jgi:hypothetical protein
MVPTLEKVAHVGVEGGSDEANVELDFSGVGQLISSS